ncbi:hypothetical protein C2G38_2040256 [Gigaspora rosea]|uniref:Uncharacterized protein n=1 Tax=Gigaspora rosea TaxID=44941 RepID=A0A397V011_9GLOM|nr:hypothetical protein C2G38_2040256 [Gigaspora rosea]
MSATSNSNTYRLLEATEDAIESAEMQIDVTKIEHKRIKPLPVETSLVSTITNTLLDEQAEKTESGETPLTTSSLMMTLSHVITKTKEPENEASTITGIKFFPNNPYIDNMHENSHGKQTYMAGMELEDQQILEDLREIVTEDISAEIDKMETESTSTIEKDKEPNSTPTYSTVLKTGDTRKRKPKIQDNTWKIITQNRIRKKLKENRTCGLNTETWTIDEITEAFKSETKLAVLIIDKCHAIPSANKLPEAIYKKFENKNMAFFKSFIRQKELRPQHQQDFLLLFEKALTKYKAQHEVTRTNKHNRDEIFAGLRIKLAIDYFKSIDLLDDDEHEATKKLFYLSGYAKIDIKPSFERVRRMVRETRQDMLNKLPETAESILAEIT